MIYRFWKRGSFSTVFYKVWEDLLNVENNILWYWVDYKVCGLSCRIRLVQVKEEVIVRSLIAWTNWDYSKSNIIILLLILQTLFNIIRKWSYLPLQPLTSIKHMPLEESNFRWSILFRVFVFSDSRDLGSIVLILKNKEIKTLSGISRHGERYQVRIAIII